MSFCKSEHLHVQLPALLTGSLDFVQCFALDFDQCFALDFDQLKKKDAVKRVRDSQKNVPSLHASLVLLLQGGTFVRGAGGFYTCWQSL